MFKGRIYYQHGGYMSNAIRFLADGADDGGVATTTYSYSMTQEERYEMARRITAALNLTRDMETEEIERRAGMTSNVQSDRRCAASSRSVQRAKRTGSTVGLERSHKRRTK